jgi:hypothetical protein
MTLRISDDVFWSFVMRTGVPPRDPDEDDDEANEEEDDEQTDNDPAVIREPDE